MTDETVTVKEPKKQTKKINYTLLKDSHMYVVLEHATGIVDAKLHGIYSTIQSAEGKKKALTEPKKDKDGNVLKEAEAKGYVCILTEHIKGAKVKHTSSSKGKIILVG